MCLAFHPIWAIKYSDLALLHYSVLVHQESNSLAKHSQKCSALLFQSTGSVQNKAVKASLAKCVKVFLGPCICFVQASQSQCCSIVARGKAFETSVKLRPVLSSFCKTGTHRPAAAWPKWFRMLKGTVPDVYDLYASSITSSAS